MLDSKLTNGRRLYSESWEEFEDVYQIINVIEFLVAGEALAVHLQSDSFALLHVCFPLFLCAMVRKGETLRGRERERRWKGRLHFTRLYRCIQSLTLGFSFANRD